MEDIDVTCKYHHIYFVGYNVSYVCRPEYHFIGYV